MISAPTLSTKQKANSDESFLLGYGTPNPMAPIENTGRGSKGAAPSKKQPGRELVSNYYISRLISKVSFTE